MSRNVDLWIAYRRAGAAASPNVAKGSICSIAGLLRRSDRISVPSES
jgi:hypothetical protein